MIGGEYVGALVSRTIGGEDVFRLVVKNIVHITVSCALALLYAKFVARLSLKQLGVVAKFPGFRWIIIGLALPLSVTAFYLIFGQGTIEKDTSSVAMVLCVAFVDTAIRSAVIGEILFRGLLLRSFSKMWNRVAGVFIPSLWFAAVHVIMMQSVDIISFLMLLVGGTLVGTMFSLIALSNRTIWASMIVHGLWNLIMIGGIFAIRAEGSGVVEGTIYNYTLTNGSLFFSGGVYGIEAGLPAIIGYVCISMIVVCLHKVDD